MGFSFNPRDHFVCCNGGHIHPHRVLRIKIKPDKHIWAGGNNIALRQCQMFRSRSSFFFERFKITFDKTLQFHHFERILYFKNRPARYADALDDRNRVAAYRYRLAPAADRCD